MTVADNWCESGNNSSNNTWGHMVCYITTGTSFSVTIGDRGNGVPNRFIFVLSPKS